MVAVLAIVLVPIFSSPALMDGLCSPAAPSYQFNNETESGIRMEAPWWAPDEYKSPAFQYVCGRIRTRTVLEWNAINKKQTVFQLLLFAVDDEEQQTLVQEKRRLVSATVRSHHIATVDSKGSVEDIPAPWVRNK